MAILRAFWQNWRKDGETVSGASTITQQLARNLLFDHEERVERTYRRKVREALAAAEITRQYTKDQILELYLNEIYYGNLAYGIEAAAQTYFGKPAQELTLAEASMLAGLPQSPVVHDPYTNPDGAKKRQADVLRLMVQAKYITQAEADAALTTELAYQPLGFAVQAPHFVSFSTRSS